MGWLFWVLGNPIVWCVAFLFLGVQWAGPAVFVLLKPVLFPFALAGANRRHWWLTLAAVAIASLAFLPMWLDYVRVVLNARDTTYLLWSVPPMCLPIVAWLGRQRATIWESESDASVLPLTVYEPPVSAQSL